MTLTIHADDVYHVFYDGDMVLSRMFSDDTASVSLSDVCVLTVKGENFEGGHGILASTSIGVVTDDTWKCSGGLEETGWHLPGFDDAAWSQAQVIAANDGSFWMGVVPEINPAAQWIWSQNSGDGVVFCRKRLC